MTDTVRKAADILYQRSGMEGNAAQTACREHAQALHDAGLLAPDLPEPDRAVASDEAEWYLPGQISIIYRSADRIGVFGLTPNRQRFHLSLTDMEAEAAAHTLRAAAQYAEEA